MRTYSAFFETLHDEQCPTGYLGRGTHYSVLRAVVFHDAVGRPLPKGQYSDFAVIWDEDHDDRAIEPIEKIYRSGLLSAFFMFGERKGGFTAVLAGSVDEMSRANLERKVGAITGHLQSGDSWPARVVDANDPENPIINASAQDVDLYLRNIAMLWELGVKAPSIEEALFDQRLLTKVDGLHLSVRLSNCLLNENIVNLGDLVQKTEVEMLRCENFGRKSVNEMKEVLASLGLHFGMEVLGWPPKIAKRSSIVKTEIENVN